MIEHQQKATAILGDLAHAAKGPFAAAWPLLDVLGSLLPDPQEEMAAMALDGMARSLVRAQRSERDLITLLCSEAASRPAGGGLVEVGDVLDEALRLARLEHQRLDVDSQAPTSSLRVRAESAPLAGVMAVLLGRAALPPPAPSGRGASGLRRVRLRALAVPAAAPKVAISISGSVVPERPAAGDLDDVTPDPALLACRWLVSRCSGTLWAAARPWSAAAAEIVLPAEP